MVQKKENKAEVMSFNIQEEMEYKTQVDGFVCLR